jgi:hypothetical protein
VARIPDHKRQAIIADIRAEKPRNQIARDHDVSVGSVTNIAKEAGLTGAFDRSATKDATAARVADMRAERAEISALLLKKARALIGDMDRPHLVFSFGGRDNVYNEHLLDRPPTGDLRNLMTSAAIAIDKHAVIERLDSATGAEEVGSLLGAFFDGLRVKHGGDETAAE